MKRKSTIKTAAMLGFVCIAMLVSGCGPKFLEGDFVMKEYEPAHTYQYMTMVGKVMVWHTGHAPDRWYLTIAQGSDIETIKVNRATYDTSKRGDYIYLD